MGKLSGGSVWAVCHGYVWLHDRHRDSGTSGYCGCWIRRSEFTVWVVLYYFHVLDMLPSDNSLNSTCVSSFCTGDDMESLLYHFLDDWLYKFCADLFFVPRVCWSSNSSAIDCHFPQTWLVVFFLPLCILTTSPLGNQSLEHRQNALQDPFHRVCRSSPEQNREKNCCLVMPREL